MSIKVNTYQLQNKSAYAASIASQLREKVNEVNSIYYSLDPKVKSRQGIGSSIRSLHKRIENAQRKMYNVSSFLAKAADSYNTAEAVIRARGARIGEVASINVGSAVIGSAVSLKSGNKALKLLVSRGNAVPRTGYLKPGERIGIGSKGEAVKELQKMLNELGYRDAKGKKLVEDGDFGTKTLEALNKYKDKNIPGGNTGANRGIVGESTWKILVLELASKKATTEKEKTDKTNDKSEGTGKNIKLEMVKLKGVTTKGGFLPVNLRSDVSDSFQKAIDEVIALGGQIRSAGADRSLTDVGRPGTSTTSMHYLGRAVDLAPYQGMQDPTKDVYVVVRDGGTDKKPIWRVYCRTENKDVEQITLNASIYSKGKGYVNKKVEDRFIDMTAIFEKYGWENISARGGYESSYMSTEWWHFQNVSGLDSSDTFNSELLKRYSQEYIDKTYAGNKKYLDYVYSGGNFSAKK
jgi:peptidoglycan hydrolase-like protein with peptidoglycan-binding domain